MALDICGDDAIFMPEEQCDSCEQFMSDIQRIDRKLVEVDESLAGKQATLTAGDNITLEPLEDGTVRISSTGGGGGGGDCITYTLDWDQSTMSLLLRNSESAIVQRLELTGTGGGGTPVTVDTAMSDSSTNAVQNRVIKAYVDNADGALDTRLTAAEGAIAGMTEPFMLYDFTQTVSSVSLPMVTSADAPGNIDVVLPASLENDWKIASVAKYEVFDAASGGNRIPAVICHQFSMNSQKTMRVGFKAASSSARTAMRIAGALLLTRRT